MPKKRICSRQPTRVCHNVAIVVDLNALDGYSDIRADENGVWKRKGAPIATVSVHTSAHGSTTKVVCSTRMGLTLIIISCLVPTTTTHVLQISRGLLPLCMVCILQPM